MNKMSGSELHDYIVRTFKRTDKTAEVYDAITDTIMDMCEEFGFEENKVEAYTAVGISALGDYKIDLPDDFGHLLGDVRWTDQDDSGTLNKLSKQQFNEKFPEQDCDDPDDGEPTDYCIFRKQLLIGPVPDRTTYEYQIDYAKFLADAVTSVSSDVMFTDNARECVKFGALARLYEVIEEWGNADRYTQKYELELAEFVSREKKNTRAIFAMKEMK